MLDIIASLLAASAVSASVPQEQYNAQTVPALSGLLGSLGGEQCLKNLHEVDVPIPNIAVADEVQDCVVLHGSNPSHVYISYNMKPIGLRVVLETDQSYHLGNRPRKVLVRLIGGPAGDISPSSFTAIYDAALAEGSILLTIGYSGTIFNNSYPLPDEAKAVKEIGGLCRYLEDLKPGSPATILVGESLGGLLAARASLSGCRNQLAGLVFISTPLNSPTMILNHIVSDMQRQGIADPIKRFRNEMPIGTAWYLGWHHAPSVALFEHFFSKDDWERDGITDLKMVKTTPVLMIYGSLDEAMGYQEAKDPQLPGFEIMRVAGMGHNPRLADYGQIETAISHFVTSMR